jgi:S1-C subfamily serine protease
VNLNGEVVGIVAAAVRAPEGSLDLSLVEPGEEIKQPQLPGFSEPRAEAHPGPKVSSGIGYAIPINTVKRVLNHLLAGKV